jgi:hypothetical protein
MLIVKLGLATVAGVLWLFGLVDQLQSWDTTALYLTLSLALVAAVL